MAGGWPGALFAQHFFRHKNRKLRYQIEFGIIILIHGVSWGWVTSNPEAVNQFKNDKHVLEGIIAEVNPIRGLVVALPAQFEGVGVVDSHKLKQSFTNDYLKGEPIHVSIKSIAMKGSAKQIELDPVED